MRKPVLFLLIAATALMGFAASRAMAADGPDALCGQAKAKLRQGKYAEAQTLLNQAQQSNPDYAPIYYIQGELYESQGNNAGARQSYEAFVQRSRGQIPPDPQVMLKLRKMGLY